MPQQALSGGVCPRSECGKERKKEEKKKRKTIMPTNYSATNAHKKHTERSVYTITPPTHTHTTRKSTLRTCWCSTGKLNVSFQMYLLLLSTTNAQYLDIIPTFYSCLTDMDVRSSNAGFYTALLSFLLA